MCGKIFFEIRVASVFRPTERSALVDRVFEVEASASSDEQAYSFGVAIQSGFVQGRGVAMEAGWVLAVWIFAGIEEKLKDLAMSMLGGESQSDLTFERASERKKADGVRDVTKTGSGGQIVCTGTAMGEGLRSSLIAMRESGDECLILCCAEIDEEFSECYLRSGDGGWIARNKHVESCLLSAIHIG